MNTNLTNISLAFADGAGIYPDTLQATLRATLLALTFIRAAWAITGTLQAVHSPDFTFFTLILRLMAILVIVTSCIALVY